MSSYVYSSVALMIEWQMLRKHPGIACVTRGRQIIANNDLQCVRSQMADFQKPIFAIKKINLSVPTLNTFLRWRGLNPLQPITNQNANRMLKLLLQHQENL
jgi:uncharacterized membrane-anchored protein